MSDAVLEGAIMPKGIEVDEAAAYFGIVKSSDAVHQMLAMNRIEALENFFAQLSDIVLTPGEFDFEAASKRMQCEGGEIYFLVAGHLSLLSVTDPLLNYLGFNNSLGEGAGNCQRESSGPDFESLKAISDPMNILKLLAIAYKTGGASEVTRYLNGFEALVSNPASNEVALLSIANEFVASLDVSGHALPIATLASGNAASSAVVAPTITPIPVQPEKQAVTSVPIPKIASIPLPSQVSVPLPSEINQATPPVIGDETIQPAQVNTENQKEVAKATQDAFAGAFNIGVEEEIAPVVEETLPEQQPEEVVQEIIEEVQPVVIEAEANEPAQEEFVSAAEHFIAADTDGSGQLSIEELAEATGTTIEEAAVLHTQADTDGDGAVSLSEFMSSAAAEKASILPKPIAPVRKPLNEKQQPRQEQPTWVPPQPRPIQPNQQQPQQGWNQQPQQQAQQGWNQPQAQIQPTIRSGVLCRGCGIGLDPNWRHCPICGSPNAGF